MASQRANRYKAEMEMLGKNPPPGIVCRQGDTMDVIMAEITGPPGSPFEKGTFTVQVSLSERYPFTPPNARFITRIYHPNVDSTGRICLSGLKPKPAGSWNCSMNIAVILSAIRLLMSEPNLGDPLMADIAAEYQDNLALFRTKAEAKTLKYAVKGAEGGESDEENEDNQDNDDVRKNDTTVTKKPDAKSSTTHSPKDAPPSKPQTSAARSSKADIEEIQLSSESEDEIAFLSYNPRKKHKS